VLLLVGLAVTSCSSGADVGTVERGGPDAPAGVSVTAALPVGELDLVLGTPVQRVAQEELDGPDDLVAPDDASIVTIGASLDALSGPGFLLGLPGAEPEVATLRLVGEDQTYDLPAPYAVAGRGVSAGRRTWSTVVTGDGSGLSLEVGYDGVVQRFDLATGDRDAGLAEGLYGLDRDAAETPWPTTGWGGGIDELTVLGGASVLRTPWAGGLGWAGAGHLWSVVAVEARIPRLQLGGRRFSTARSEVAVTLDGLGPVEPGPATLDLATSLGEQLVFDSTADAPLVLSVEGTLDVSPFDGRGTEREVRVGQSLDLGA
jgi:hypothetical protein